MAVVVVVVVVAESPVAVVAIEDGVDDPSTGNV